MRVPVSIAVLIAGLALATACGGGSSKTARPDETPQADASDGQLVSTLVPASASFRVEFAWTEGAPGGKTGDFVWTQAAGARRWDFSPEGAAKARIGWFSIESNFSGAGAPASTLDCLWEHSDGANVRVGCDAVRPNHPGADALTRTLSGLRLAGRYADRTIAGHNASCYAFRDSQHTFGEICIDDTTKAPLAFSATGAGRNKAFHVFEATAVTDAPASVPSPAGIASGTSLSPVTRPASALALPPEFVLPQ
jgi:hypothetical protein